MGTVRNTIVLVVLGLTFITSQVPGQVNPPGSRGIENDRLGSGSRSVWWNPSGYLPTGVLPQQMPKQSAQGWVLPGVRHTVPGDFATIQAAIDASSDGDTVLVSEGKYMENIRYRGKAIVVGSLYLIDGDTSHISKTIIDGSGSTEPDSCSVVYFVNGEDTTSVLCGVTIQGGSGTRGYLVIPTVSCWYRAGGGVFCDRAGASIIRNIITHNRVVARLAMGGGVEALGTSTSHPYLILDANRIEDNYVQSDTVTETEIWGFSGGANILMSARVVNNVFERDTVVSHSGASGGGLALCGFTTSPQLPSACIAGNIFRSNFASCTGMTHGAYGGGAYVAWTADVTILDNLFESNTVSAVGTGHQWVDGGGLDVDDGGVAGYGRKTITGNRFVNNRAQSTTINSGGGVCIRSSSATISRNRFEGNSTNASSEPGGRGGAGINIHASSFRLDNNIFTGNHAGSDGGAMTIGGIYNVQGAVINNTVVDNYAALSGGGLMTSAADHLVLMNNIFWNDTATSGSEIYDADASLGLVTHCDVQGGYPGSGNIDADPALAVGDTLFHLTVNSPCIESAVDSVRFRTYDFLAPVNDFDGVDRPMPADTPPDIGAQEDQITTVAYAHHVTVTPLTLRKSLDTLRIHAIVENPNHHTLDVAAITSDFVDGAQDSLPLFNDGLHGDGMANDTLWGGLTVPTKEGVYGVSVRTVDDEARTNRTTPVDEPSFVTAGPLKYVGYRCWEFASDSIPGPGVDLYVRVGLQNCGTAAPINNVTALASAVDPLEDYAGKQPFSWGTLFPGDTIYYSTNYMALSIGYDRVVGDTASFALDIASNGLVFWRDTIRVILKSTGIDTGIIGLPTSYALEQNYPNPFNPSTTINYELSAISHVTLTVYDLLGRAVRKLVNEKKGPGTYEVKFDASDLSSGVYFYRLVAGSRVITKKMLLMK